MLAIRHCLLCNNIRSLLLLLVFATATTTTATTERTCSVLNNTLISSGTAVGSPVKTKYTGTCCDLCAASVNCRAVNIVEEEDKDDGRSYLCVFYSQYNETRDATKKHWVMLRPETPAPSTTPIVTPPPPTNKSNGGDFISGTTFLVILLGVAGAALFFLLGLVYKSRSSRSTCCRGLGVTFCCCCIDDLATPEGWRYTIISELGTGTFSSVFLVRCHEDGEKRALKLIMCSTMTDLHNALAEYRFTLQLQGHPNLVAVHDMFTNWADTVSACERQRDSLRSGSWEDNGGVGGEEPKYLCLVMTYYPEGTLLDLLARLQTPLPEVSVVRLSRDVAAALSYMHEHSIIHRDLKPANVLLDADYTRAVVTDFGLSKAYLNGEYCKTRAGTLHYMAPEQADGHYTVHADMWAFGCLIYGMATRRVVQPGVRVMFMARRSPNFEEEVRTEMRALGYSDGLADLIFCLLSARPGDRPGARDAMERLDAMLATHTQ
eukprot:PhM_4_TR726/c0_g1_i1/m.47979